MAKLVVDVVFFISATLARGGIGALLLKLTGAILLNTLGSKLFGPKIPSAQSRLAGHSIMARSGVEYRRIVYGEAPVSGPVVYNNSSGATRQDLWYMVALCEGEIEDVVSIYVDAQEILKNEIAWTAGTGGAAGSGTGAVSTNQFMISGNNGLYAYYGLGHDNQVALTEMVSAFSQWTSAHRLRGVAYVALKCVYTAETEKVWQGGAPQNIRAVVRGRKVYDPRLDSTRVIDSSTSPDTFGTGLHRITDETTWAWTDNPALCVVDYLYSYMGVAAASIDWEAVATAADHCDEQVDIPPAASPANTETRFTCNGVISLGESHKDNIDKLLSSFDGTLTYTGGVWKVRSSQWEASSVSFTESDFVGKFEVRGAAPKGERSNKVRGVFIDPARDYEPSEFPAVINSTYLTRDNSETITKDLELPMVNSVYEAQRVAFRLLEHDNRQRIVKATVNARGALCEVGDVVDLTITKYSWTAETFRVIEWQRNPLGTYDLTLKQDDSTAYADPLVSDYIDGNSANITLPSEVVPPPTNLSASSVPYAIRLNWTNPATLEFDYIDVYASATSAWSGASRIASVRTDTYTHNLGSGTLRYYWIRARRNNGDVSTRVPDSDTSTVSGTSGAGTDSVNVAGATLSDQQETAVAEVGYRFTSAGQEESYEGDPPSPISWDTIGTWLLDGTAANFSVKLTKSAGTDPTSGTLNSWLALSADRTWVWTDSTQNDVAVTFTGTIEIADNTTSPNTVLGSATVSVTIDAQTPDVTLSGGDPLASPAGTPRSIIDNQADPNTAVAGWSFNADGTVDQIDTTNPGVVRYTQFATGVEWLPTVPSPSPYSVRFTAYDGDAPSSGTMGSWQALTADREFRMTQATNGALDGTVKVEIADDTSPVGTNIVATGYYRARAFRSL